MGLHRTDLPREVLEIIANGTVIPAHPLALDASRRFDRRRQRALTRYYIDAGAGGLAVGVHTTQFAIREAGLYETVLAAAVEDSRQWAGCPETAINAMSLGHDNRAFPEISDPQPGGSRRGIEIRWHCLVRIPGGFG